MNIRSNSRWKYIMPAVFLYCMIDIADRGGLSLIATSHSFVQTMGVAGHPEKIGFLGTGVLLSYGICSFVWGFIVDKIGAKRSGIISALIFGLALVGTSLSNSYTMLFIFLTLMGAGTGAIFPFANKMVGNWFHINERSRAQSTWNLGKYVGQALTTPLIIATIVASGWRGGFLMMAGFAIIIVVPVLIFFTKDSPELHSATNSLELEYINLGRILDLKHESGVNQEGIFQKKGFWGTVLLNYRYWLVVIGFLVMGIIYYGMSFWFPTYLKTARHFSLASMGGWVSFSWILAAVITFLGGVLADKTKRPALIGVTGMLLPAIALYIAAVTSSGVLAAAMVSLGIAIMAPAIAICNELIVREAGEPRWIGRAVGIMACITGVLGSFSAPLMGWVVKVSNGNFMDAILFLVGCSVVGAISFGILLINEKPRKAGSVGKSVSD